MFVLDTNTHKAHTKPKNNNLQFLDKLLEVALGGLLSHNLEHLLANISDLTGLGIASRLDSLVGLLLGEGNSKDAQIVSISGAHIDVSLNKGLPLSNQRAKLVAGHVHTSEVGHDIVTLDILAHQLDLAESLSLITAVQVSERGLEDAPL